MSENNYCNKCDTCKKEFATCKVGPIVFAGDVVNDLPEEVYADTVLWCSGYENREQALHGGGRRGMTPQLEQWLKEQEEKKVSKKASRKRDVLLADAWAKKQESNARRCDVLFGTEHANIDHDEGFGPADLAGKGSREWFRREVVERRLESIRKVLGEKQAEYAIGSVFHNFERAGELQGCSPERALLGMMAKHWVSVMDMVEQRERGEAPGVARIEEKIGDSVNYLILLEGMLKEAADG